MEMEENLNIFRSIALSTYTLVDVIIFLIEQVDYCSIIG